MYPTCETHISILLLFPLISGWQELNLQISFYPMNRSSISLMSNENLSICYIRTFGESDKLQTGSNPFLPICYD